MKVKSGAAKNSKYCIGTWTIRSMIRVNWTWSGLSVGSALKLLPETQETLVQLLGQEDPLEKEMATHSSTLAWKIPMDRGIGQSIIHGVARVRHDLGLNHHHQVGDGKSKHQILGINKLKWMGMGEFNSDYHCIFSWGQESHRRNEVALIINK